MFTGIEVVHPFMNDVGVGQIFLVESNNSPFPGKDGLQVFVYRRRRYAGIANFNDEVGKLEALADGPGGGGHVAREPIDGAAPLVEP